VSHLTSCAVLFLSAALATGSDCTIEGTVLNTKTGEPVRKAEILLLAMDRPAGSLVPPAAVTADAAGKFRFQGLAAGRYSVRAERGGFLRMIGIPGSDRGPVLVTLAEGESSRDVKLRLIPGALLAGRVLDEDGEPVIGARVQTMQTRYESGRRQLAPVSEGDAGEILTDDLGQFRIHSLPPGRYYLMAAQRDRQLLANAAATGPSGAQEEQGYPAVLYPGVLNPSQTAPVEVREGEQRYGLDIRMLRVRTIRVRGKVLGIPAERRSPVTVMLVSRQGFSLTLPSTITREDATYEIRGAAPGAYYLVARYDRDGLVVSARRALDVADTPIADADLALRPSFELKGRVVLAKKDPKAQFDTLVEQVELEDENGWGGASAVVRPDGTFTIENLFEGVHRPGVRLHGLHYYVKTVRLGDADATDKPLHLTEAAAANELEVVLSADAASLEGTVTGETATPGVAARAFVVLVPEDRSRFERYRVSSTDQAGRFRIRAIVPGEYGLFAWDYLAYNEHLDPDFLKPFEEKRTRIALFENDRKSVDIVLLKTGEASK
jgi:hypothetical protein